MSTGLQTNLQTRPRLAGQNCCALRTTTSSRARRHVRLQRQALGDSGQIHVKNLESAVLAGGEDKKFITREQEPDSFWQTKTEAKGQNPAKDPLAIMGILGLLVPFIILGLAIATGVVDVNGGR